MRHLIPLLLFAIAALTASAAHPRKNLDVKNWPDGTVVFVKPAKMPRAENSVAAKPMEYDMAINTANDTVVVTCSIITATTHPIDSATIGRVGAYAVEQLFVEPAGGNKWISRVRLSIPRSDFEAMIRQPAPPLIDFDGASFRHPAKKWNDFQQTYSLALIIIDQNKKR